MMLPVGCGGLFEAAAYEHNENLGWECDRAAKMTMIQLGLDTLHTFGAELERHPELSDYHGFNVWTRKHHDHH